MPSQKGKAVVPWRALWKRQRGSMADSAAAGIHSVCPFLTCTGLDQSLDVFSSRLVEWLLGSEVFQFVSTVKKKKKKRALKAYKVLKSSSSGKFLVIESYISAVRNG